MVTLLLPPLLAAWWRRVRQRQPAPAALAWLLLALVVAPTVGRLHQVEHAEALGQMRAGHAATQAHRAATFIAQGEEGDHGAAEPGHAHRLGGHSGLLSLLLASHAPADCLLLDQLALGEVLHCVPHAPPAPVPAQAPRATHTGRAAAPHIALFQARGPPAA